jgi:hypothetical protein
MDVGRRKRRQHPTRQVSLADRFVARRAAVGARENSLVALEPSSPEQNHQSVLRSDETRTRLEKILGGKRGVCEPLVSGLGRDQHVEPAAVENDSLLDVTETVGHQPRPHHDRIGLGLEDEAP